jgi:hypothetical protein
MLQVCSTFFTLQALVEVPGMMLQSEGLRVLAVTFLVCVRVFIVNVLVEHDTATIAIAAPLELDPLRQAQVHHSRHESRVVHPPGR